MHSEYALSGKTKTSHFQSKLNELEKERQSKEESRNGRTDRDLTHQDFHIFLYNQAVVCYHQRSYKNSIGILTKLKDNFSSQTSVRGSTFYGYNGCIDYGDVDHKYVDYY